MAESRISFGHNNAEHLYEALLQGGVHKCEECRAITARLKAFIGAKNARRIERAVRLYPLRDSD